MPRVTSGTGRGATNPRRKSTPTPAVSETVISADPTPVAAKPYLIYTEDRYGELSDPEQFTSLNSAKESASARARELGGDTYNPDESVVFIARIIGRVESKVEVKMEE